MTAAVVPFRPTPPDAVAEPGAQIVPPHNIEAEQALLGAMLINNAAYHRVSDLLLPEYFAEAVHGRIYAAISKLIERGQIANPVTLKNLFDQDGALTEIGGVQYLTQLAAGVVTIVNAEDYATTIRDLYRRRQLLEIAQHIVDEACNPDLDGSAEAVVGNAEERLYALADEGKRGANTVSAGASASAAIAAAEAAYKLGGRLVGVPSGLADLDRTLGGFKAGQLILLAGRPSMGKSLAADVFAMAAAKSFLDAGARKAVLFFSLEMTAEELATRRLASITGLSATNIQRGRLGSPDFPRLGEAQLELDRLPLFTDDTPGLTVADLRSRARRLARAYGLGLIIVDHIGFMGASKDAKRAGDTAVITEISAGLKRLAKDLGVPVLALSQLNRELEKREDKRPMLADLRQSGSLEQDADVVLFIYREEYYLSRSKPVRRDGEKEEAFLKRKGEHEDRLAQCKNTADLIIAKHRGGPIGDLKAFFDGARGLLQNLSQGEISL